ncbi:MAG TPA: hypothetical protein VMF89_30100, partial [Polyangiales bacterium]|nr:hypothetical protein [Polyangiales bacterium]
MSEHLSFSTRHAFIMLAGVALSGACASSLPLALAALGSFAFWLFESRASFLASGFGSANWITS